MVIYFIGIGGIGVSAIAQYFLSKGDEIIGSDLKDSETTKFLREKGVKILIGQKKENITEAYQYAKEKKEKLIVIYTPAAKKDNPELKEAIKLKEKFKNIEVMSYPEALGKLTKKYFTIAVSGTHGKSTTSSMVALALIEAGLDPTVIVGTKLKEFGNSNFRLGKSNFLVIESDESSASFLNYQPDVAIVTNIEKDHLDFYKNLKNIKKSFEKYLSLLKGEKTIIANKDNKETKEIAERAISNSLAKKVVYYSLEDKEANEIKKILKIPGEHNVSNALAALSLAKVLPIRKENIINALAKFKGTWRRFEEKKKKIGGRELPIIFDYGHHPTEIMATAKAAREKYYDREIILLFQPHQYQRTYFLYNEFKKAIKEITGDENSKKIIDLFILTDIFSVAGREDEAIKKMVSVKKMAEEIKKENVIHIKKEVLKEELPKIAKENSIIIIMGAGDIYEFIQTVD